MNSGRGLLVVLDRISPHRPTTVNKRGRGVDSGFGVPTPEPPQTELPQKGIVECLAGYSVRLCFVVEVEAGPAHQRSDIERCLIRPRTNTPGCDGRSDTLLPSDYPNPGPTSTMFLARAFPLWTVSLMDRRERVQLDEPQTIPKKVEGWKVPERHAETGGKCGKVGIPEEFLEIGWLLG